MPRLNVYLPDELHELADKWRGSLNLSEICSRALRAEIEAAASNRSARGAVAALRTKTPEEKDLCTRFGLVDAIIEDTPAEESELREALGARTARYLDHWLSEGAELAISGGRQMWCLVRNMSPRNLRVTFTALGIHQNDPHVLHAHPNTLVTLLWLLYAPRAEAHLVGSPLSVWASTEDMPNREYPRYFVVGSCDRFDPDSSFSKLLGDEGTAYLLEKEASGDFAYAFLGREGLIEPPSSGDHTFIGGERLKALARRKDARVILVAGGPAKLPTTKAVLMNGLCNVLVTDKESSRALLKGSEGGYGQQKRYPRDLSPNS